MSKPIPIELALVAKLKQSTERASAALDAMFRYLDESKAGQDERDKAARIQALIEFESLDVDAVIDTLTQRRGKCVHR